MNISIYITPLFIALIIILCIIKKVPVYDTVTDGAKEGMEIIINIFPTMVVILTAVSMLRASGAVDMFINFVSPFTDMIKIPKEILPLALIRPISGSGALGIVADNLKTYGPDSRLGIISSVIMGSTETTFYTLAVYFSTINVKNIKKIIPCALIGDIVGILVSCLIVK